MQAMHTMQAMPTMQALQEEKRLETQPEEVQPEEMKPEIVQKPVQLELFRENLPVSESGTDIAQNTDYILDVDFESQYRIIGQVFKTYWLVEYKADLLLIDQHAAHEKVKYENLMEHLEQKEIISEPLNPPTILRLSSGEIQVFTEYEEMLGQLGFRAECFGGNDYAIRAVPMDLYGFNPKEMFLEILDELAGHPMRQAPEAVLHRMATMACKAAVKGNTEMNEVQAKELIHQLLKLKNPYHCPHGRPVIVAMSKAEVERKFKRIVN